MPRFSSPGGRVPLATDSDGQVSNQPLTFGTPAQVTVGAAAGNLVAADAVGSGREVTIYVPKNATTGVYVNKAGTATASHFLIEPGQGYTYSTQQAISAIRAGAADVTVYVEAAKV